MREIKFRAWDGFKMHEVCRLGCYGFSTDLRSSSPVSCLAVRTEALKIMQFTGLKDKNNKEIYEGDILKIENPKCQFQKATLIGTVVFQYSSFGVEIKQIAQWEGYSEFASRPNVVWLLNIIDNKEFEVIGNIYENPELMEAK